MSRSYHVTIRSLERLERWCFSNQSQKEELCADTSQKLSKKRKTKLANFRWRRSPANLSGSCISTIPIHVSKEGEYDHHLITEDDARALLTLLPAGTTDGLSAIDLCLGKEHQDIDEANPDPFTGRFGSEFVADIFAGECYGCYYPHSARVFIFNWVYAPKNQIASLLTPYLKLYSLGTLMHEIAHHFDALNRLKNPRWCVRDQKSKEIYAEKMEHMWIQELVSEYLMETYPQECKRLLDWVSEYSGINLTLADLAPECRSTTKGAGDGISLRSFYSLHQGFLEMVENYEEGKPVESCRRDFSLWLATSDHYDEALFVNDQFLKENPRDIFALTERIRIFRLLKKFEEARQIAANVLEWAPDSVEVLNALCRVEERTENWVSLQKLAQKYQNCSDYATYDWSTACLFLGKAFAGLGNWSEFEEICRQLGEIDANYNRNQIRALRRFADQ